MKTIATIILSIFAAVALVPAAQANVKQLKVYRTVYPNFKPKCGYCHVDDKPKKDDGKHDLNAYGQKLQELMAGGELTEEMVQSVGSHEEFEANMDAAAEDMSLKNTEEKIEEMAADAKAKLSSGAQDGKDLAMGLAEESGVKESMDEVQADLAKTVSEE